MWAFYRTSDTMKPSHRDGPMSLFIADCWFALSFSLLKDWPCCPSVMHAYSLFYSTKLGPECSIVQHRIMHVLFSSTSRLRYYVGQSIAISVTSAVWSSMQKNDRESFKYSM